MPEKANIDEQEVLEAPETIGEVAEDSLEPGIETPQVEIKDDGRSWYVIHTYSGYENKVRDNILRRIRSMNLADRIFQVIIPMEEEIEFKDGKRRTLLKKIYPGYVLVEMTLTDETWYVVRNTSGVTGFVGAGVKPIPLSDEEVKQVLRQIDTDKPSKVSLFVSIGEGIRVKSGPFKDFTGIVQEINTEKEKVKVSISIFGRETPVELDFSQVDKL